MRKAARFAAAPEAYEIVDAVEAYLTAFCEAENSLWRIGDSLITLCGPPGPNGAHNESNVLIERVAQRIKQHFGDRAQAFKVVYLRRLRSTAHNFPPDTRVSGAAWAVHYAASEPETLNRAHQEAKRLGVNFTVAFVKAFIAAPRGKQKLEWVTQKDELRRSAVDIAERAEWVTEFLRECRTELTATDLKTLSDDLADVTDRLDSARASLHDIACLLHPGDFLEEAA
jgi:hypothetical protein